mmetsp:Transcript_36257/g.88220  ORF Transcript_36257/g.88220 Transcript_36257/m.88220 type:complete len:375 (+) Transcript_36257:4948-6072(+)
MRGSSTAKSFAIPVRNVIRMSVTNKASTNHSNTAKKPSSSTSKARKTGTVTVEYRMKTMTRPSHAILNLLCGCMYPKGAGIILLDTPELHSSLNEARLANSGTGGGGWDTEERLRLRREEVRRMRNDTRLKTCGSLPTSVPSTTSASSATCCGNLPPSPEARLRRKAAGRSLRRAGFASSLTGGFLQLSASTNGFSSFEWKLCSRSAGAGCSLATLASAAAGAAPPVDKRLGRPLLLTSRSGSVAPSFDNVEDDLFWRARERHRRELERSEISRCAVLFRLSSRERWLFRAVSHAEERILVGVVSEISSKVSPSQPGKSFLAFDDSSAVSNLCSSGMAFSFVSSTIASLQSMNQSSPKSEAGEAGGQETRRDGG